MVVLADVTSTWHLRGTCTIENGGTHMLVSIWLKIKQITTGATEERWHGKGLPGPGVVRSGGTGRGRVISRLRA